jgi:hypothetical protein
VPSRVDKAPVAAHVRMLLDAHWTKDQIAAAGGVSRKTVWNILHGERPTVQIGTARSLLTLRPDRRIGGMLPALGAMRRLHALAAMGWPLAWSAEQVGISYTAARDISSGRTKAVQDFHHRAIDLLYRKHAMQLGPSAMARAVARSKQWPTAAAWDDIDDPRCEPDFGAQSPPSRIAIAAHRLDEITFLVDFNVAEHEIAERLGMCPQYVHDVIRDKVRPPAQHITDRAALLSVPRGEAA